VRRLLEGQKSGDDDNGWESKGAWTWAEACRSSCGAECGKVAALIGSIDLEDY
jgi:hypothetical protein